ncbi:MAG: Hsp33 family molecular chaperone HslO [Nevskia sp.]
MPNLLTPFQFNNHIAHGAFVEITTGVAEMLDQRVYDPAVRELVGQAMAAMPLLATHSRFEGRINLQFQGERAIKLLVAQVTQNAESALQVRSMAKAAAQVEGSYAELLSDGVLALMLEPASDLIPSHQAMVPIDGHSLSESLEGYFAQSEQLPTLIRLAASQDKLVGFMLQRLPLEHTKMTEETWEHLAILAGTLGSIELLATPPETLLRRLFADEQWVLNESRPITVSCRCSREGISLLLLSMGRTEVEQIVTEQGRVAVVCEFCGKEYVYSKSDAVTLFAAEGSEQSLLKH